MRKTSVITFLILMTLMAGTALAGDCNNGNFHGSYTRVDAPTDLFGDGNLHQHVYNLVLGTDGSAKQYWTGLPDYQINTGTGSPSFGSWKCRNDGKIVVNIVTASYSPVEPDGINLFHADVTLTGYLRTTILFNVNNQNKLTRIQSRNRGYGANEDPTNPAGGTLGALNNTQFIYNRVIASDADLLAP